MPTDTTNWRETASALDAENAKLAAEAKRLQSQVIEESDSADYWCETALQLNDAIQPLRCELDDERRASAWFEAAALALQDEVAALQHALDGLRQRVSRVHALLDGMDAKLTALEADTRWVPVTERLPEDGASVLLAVTGCCSSILGYRTQDLANRTIWIDLHGGRNYSPTGTTGVTHWRPLPAPPQDQT